VIAPPFLAMLLKERDTNQETRDTGDSAA
jgi:hypothetical protein